MSVHRFKQLYTFVEHGFRQHRVRTDVVVQHFSSGVANFLQQRRRVWHHIHVARVGVKLESDQVGATNLRVDHFMHVQPNMKSRFGQKREDPAKNVIRQQIGAAMLHCLMRRQMIVFRLPTRLILFLNMATSALQTLSIRRNQSAIDLKRARNGPVRVQTPVAREMVNAPQLHVARLRRAIIAKAQETVVDNIRGEADDRLKRVIAEVWVLRNGRQQRERFARRLCVAHLVLLVLLNPQWLVFRERAFQHDDLRLIAVSDTLASGTQPQVQTLRATNKLTHTRLKMNACTSCIIVMRSDGVVCHDSVCIAVVAVGGGGCRQWVLLW